MNEIVAFPPAFPLFATAIFLSAVATVVCEEAGWRRGVYLFKPLTTVLILAFASLGGSDPAYSRLICTGLVFSLVGDVFLMLPKDRFVAGLVSFLVAHLLYIAAFSLGGIGFAWAPAIVYALYAAVLLRILLPRVGALRVPVLVYALVLMAMAWLAAAGHTGGWLAAVGAALFVVSDSALAINRFVRPFPSPHTLVLPTYYAAQTLIAFSNWFA
jgi:uncharacterized membrane protein YhhN